ncbi:MAG: lamin tail domain-containing protein [Bacteroidota bacterium]
MRLFTFFILLFMSSFLVAQTNHAVDVTSNVFTPENLTIQAGDTVTWTNLQGFHNVNGLQSIYPDNPEGFRNGNAAGPGWVYEFVFNTHGVYDYQCDPHVNLGMVGTITVEGDVMAENTVAITEIMYNPPEGGNDSLEFIEMVNFGDAAVDMTGWTISDAFQFTFPDFTLDAGAYAVVAINSASFGIVFPDYSGGLFQWESGALNNSGESITLLDASGATVSAVAYSDDPPWPGEADGDGPSLIRCDIEADGTSPLNWQASPTSTGVTINGNEVLADPGAAGMCSEVMPVMFFTTTFDALTEGDDPETYQLIAQGFAAGATVQMIVNNVGGVTTITTDDATTVPVLAADFTTTGAERDTFEVEVTILDDDEVEDEEFLVLRARSDDGEYIGEDLRIAFRDNDAEVVITNIADINDLDDDGVAIFEDSIRTLQGVVHCMDFDGNNGYSFFILEPATGDGITVFDFNDVDDYQVTEGDELQITGRIDQFNGLLQIRPQQITVVSQGNDLLDPIEVTALGEDTESKLITLLLSTETPTTDFIGSGFSFNVTAVAEGGDTINVRIDSDTDIDSMFIADYFAANAAAGIAITGFGSQFDNSGAPFDAGYQILPCGTESFNVIISTVDPVWASEVKLYPNPTSSLLNISAPIQLEGYRLFDVNGRVLQSSQATFEQQAIDLSQLPKGAYYLQLLGADGVITRPIMKQ